MQTSAQCRGRADLNKEVCEFKLFCRQHGLTLLRALRLTVRMVRPIASVGGCSKSSCRKLRQALRVIYVRYFISNGFEARSMPNETLGFTPPPTFKSKWNQTLTLWGKITVGVRLIHLENDLLTSFVL